VVRSSQENLQRLLALFIFGLSPPSSPERTWLNGFSQPRSHSHRLGSQLFPPEVYCFLLRNCLFLDSCHGHPPSTRTFEYSMRGEDLFMWFCCGHYPPPKCSDKKAQAFVLVSKIPPTATKRMSVIGIIILKNIQLYLLKVRAEMDLTINALRLSSHDVRIGRSINVSEKLHSLGLSIDVIVKSFRHAFDTT
jgi:hypothetical protein